MFHLDSERQLEALAIQLISRGRHKGPASAGELERISAAILNGHDPLGTTLMTLRSAEGRRLSGAVYTPAAIVDAMIEWAAAETGAPPERIVDPGSGSGRFILAAARAFPNAKLVGIEIDPLAVKLLRANAAAAGCADRLSIHTGDFRTFALPHIHGRTLFIGNPPYVRHHQINTESKVWFGATAQRLGFRASKLAGLHIHFFLRTRELAQAGDFGSFITSSEWMDVNYGSVLRHMLANGLGGTSLHVIDPTASPFSGTMTTGAIACFRVGNRPKSFTVRAVPTLDSLKPLTGGRLVDWITVEKTPRWSSLARPAVQRPPGVIELGELFRVHRGQVTGCNPVWIAGPTSHDLPPRFLIPSITRGREIITAGNELASTSHLRRVVDLPVELDSLTAAERRTVNRFLKWAESCGARKAYVAQNRRAWWSVGLPEPPPILCTYMARRPPTFVRNTAKASLLNIAHGLYPIIPMSDADLTAVLRYLRTTVSAVGGRTYAGGLVKFEPREVERLLIPSPSIAAGS